MPTPILTDQVTYSIDRTRPQLRYVTYVDRDAILRDFIAKLQAHAATAPAIR